MPGKFHEQRSLAIYRPWGHNESNTTVHAHRHRRLLFCLQSLEFEPNTALRKYVGFVILGGKNQINHFKLRYISYAKKFSFEHYILVIAYLYIV